VGQVAAAGWCKGLKMRAVNGKQGREGGRVTKGAKGRGAKRVQVN